MSENGSRPLRPLAKTRPVVSEAFAGLLERATRDPEAAAGLALAYAGFEPRIRRAVIEAIVADSETRELDASAVLASLLGVEPDSEVCRDIACALSATAGDRLQARCSERALFAGDETRGALLYARPLFGIYLEALELEWLREKGVTRAVFHPLTTEEKLEAIGAETPADLPFEPVPVAHAVDRTAAVLWEHRKRIGRLPSALEPFFDLFSLAPEG